jgi:hypothetical protein
MVLLVAGLALRIEWRREAPVTKTAEVESYPASLPVAPEPEPSPVQEVAEVKLAPVTETKPEPRTVPEALPKEEYFPARTPLTAEERALVAWVRRSPAEAAQVFAELPDRGIEPIEIEPIEIPPLQSNGSE